MGVVGCCCCCVFCNIFFTCKVTGIRPPNRQRTIFVCLAFRHSTLITLAQKRSMRWMRNCTMSSPQQHQQHQTNINILKSTYIDKFFFYFCTFFDGKLFGHIIGSHFFSSLIFLNGWITHYLSHYLIHKTPWNLY